MLPRFSTVSPACLATPQEAATRAELARMLRLLSNLLQKANAFLKYSEILKNPHERKNLTMKKFVSLLPVLTMSGDGVRGLL